MELRSGQQQLNEEVAAMYKRMTDPVEQEKERIKEEEREQVELIAKDTGL